MISTVTLTFDLTYVDPLTQTVVPKGIVTDSTNYTALGLIPADFELKGLGQITFNGTLIEDFNTVLSPLIPLDSGVSTFYFNLPLDVNGNVANGVYTLLYRLRVSSQLTDTPVTATAPSLVTAVSNQWIANFLEAGDIIDVVEPFSSPETVTVLAVNQVGANAEITVSNYALSSPDYITFDIIHDQLSAVYNYSGCVQSAAKVNFTYDCEYGDNGTFAVSNATELNGQTILSLSAMINYPSWTSSNPNFNPQIITNTLPYSNNVLATGTFNVSLSEVIEKVQNDGLIIQYTASSIQEFNVSCIGSLCNLIPCIESLRNAHAIELQRNRISKYQVFVDNVLMYYAEAQNYRSCGDLEAYRNTLALLEAQLDASGCECGCCDPDTYQWVSNNSSATIESLINAIQFQLKAGVPDGDDDIDSGVQIGAIWQDTLTQTLYICTNNAPAGNATWSVYYTPGGGLVPSNGLSTVGSNVVLGGALTGNTLINTLTYNMKVATASNVAPLLVESGATTSPTISVLKTSLSASSISEAARIRSTTSLAQTGFGVSTNFYLSDSSNNEQLAGAVKFSWDDSTLKDSVFSVSLSESGVISDKLKMFQDGTFRLLGYGSGSQTGNAAYNIGVATNGNLVETPSAPLIYVARITQIGSSAPTETVIANTTGATFTWSVVVSGIYKITASSPVLTTDKTAIYVTPSSSGAYIMMASVGSTTECTVTSSNAFGIGGYTNGLINQAIVKIEIYP